MRIFNDNLLLWGTIALVLVCQPSEAAKLDYSTHRVVVDEGLRGIVDGRGAQPYPAAFFRWTSPELPSAEKPQVAIIDYQTPVRVAALAHYFYVPGCRDHRDHDWLSGPSAFAQVKIYAGDDRSHWKLVSDLKNLPTACPQLLKITDPTNARYLKLEVLGLAPGAKLRTYEIETYVDEAPAALPNSDQVSPEKSGLPNKNALKPTGSLARAFAAKPDDSGFTFVIPASGTASVAGSIDVAVDGALVHWDKHAVARGNMSGTVNGSRLDMKASVVKAGLLLEFTWKGACCPPYRKISVSASPGFSPNEWCIPGYEHTRSAPGRQVEYSSALLQTRLSSISDGKVALTLVPDTDRSWVAFADKCVFASFPATKESSRVLLMGSAGDWYSGFRKAVSEVYDFGEPRQMLPVSQALTDICKMLMAPQFWCEKYDTMYAWPGSEVFMTLYDLPYTTSAMMIWERLSDDPAPSRKIDKMLKFTLDHLVKDGPMRGSIYSHLYSQEKLTKGEMSTWPPYQEWKDNRPREEFVGMDQASRHWITSHTPGSVLWSITQVWMSRGAISDSTLEGARKLADWMLRTQRADGSWPYSFNADGSVAYPESDSGTIWNVWSLYRFGQLTREAKYSEAAAKAATYFKETFTRNHLYRGYWEDNMITIPDHLNSRQGYESTLATLAFAEMGDKDAAISSAYDATKFVCTRQLECRDYWTSYGGVSEQQCWAPATYLACPFGYALQKAWLLSKDDFLGRFAFSPKVIGTMQQTNGWSCWVVETIGQVPIEEFVRTGRGSIVYWAGWEAAQKVTFGVPWLVQEANRRSGGRMSISTDTLSGRDDRGAEVAMKVFNGEVSSRSGQVNWIGLRSSGGKEYQLVLINHAEPTEVSVKPPFANTPVSARLYDSKARLKAMNTPAASPSGTLGLRLPANSMSIIAWDTTPRKGR